MRRFLGDWTDILLDPNSSDQLLTPNELVEQFDVRPQTLKRWVADRQISYIRTPTGHYRFLKSEVLSLLREDGTEDGEFLTTDEVADLLRVHPRTVRRMVKSGRIVPEGAEDRIPKSEVRRFISASLRS